MTNIDGALGSAEGLLAGLLDISRLDSGALTPVREAFDLRMRIERIVDGQSAIAAEASAEARVSNTACPRILPLASSATRL